MKKQKTIKLINTIWVTGCGILFLLPLLWMMSASVKAGSEVFSLDFHWLPETFRWENYRRVWNDSKVPFWHLYLNSIFVAVVGTAGQLLVSSMAAYALAKINFKGKNIVFTAMLITMMIPAQATIIPRYMMFYTIKIYDTLWALILPSLFNITSIFLLRQFYAGLPDELLEAAVMDGASHREIWWRIIVPLTKPPMVTVTVLAFINAWNEYLNALIFLPSNKNFTVSLGIQYWMQMTDEYNLMMAAAASAIIPVIVLFLFTQKYFIESIASTGVKG
ncbi:MAG: carbohydrate ABC transporter permease [Clostridiaceae bacterium]|nr:carbohydrate ABC transporter permease [Clostridiaceae bacterium]